MVDRTTRWPEVVPLSLTTSAEVARMFVSSWVSRFGVSLDLTSDRGPQFMSVSWTAVAENLKVNLHRTATYHPEANGLCERFHRTIKVLLRASLVRWVDGCLGSFWACVQKDLESSSAELVLG
uniref:Gypsy retrotransposon integrase 1 n=2 Tax=Nothobranchius kuhntae TaxID=321403 RepID=A0A1A8IIS7_NOTKU